MLRRTLLLLAGLSLPGAGQESPIVIKLEGDPPEVRVANSAILKRLANPRLENFLKVYPNQPGAKPLEGEYSAAGGVLIFRPLVPLEAGARYRAEFQLVNERAEAVLAVPAPKVPSTTLVEQVYPSARRLPANLARLYIHFSAPMKQGHATDHLRIVDAQGAELKWPAAPQELWDRDSRRLTLVLNPARTNGAIAAGGEWPLKEGQAYRLVIDRQWPDAQGLPLKAGQERRFEVVAPIGTPAAISDCKVAAPRVGTTEPLAIDFPQPIDSALLLRFLEVNDSKGQPVSGRIVLDQEERRWLFAPAQPWAAGRYSIDILASLEDIAGNRVGGAGAGESASIPFEVR